jgi:hypoxanthine-guanine phosphoribosyltransferase
MYKWQDGQRTEVSNDLIDLEPLAGKRVLLVAGDVLSGGTMKFHRDELKRVGVAEVRTACMVKGATATLQPDFFGKEIPADFRMPWMYKGYGYVRDSRRPASSSKTARV